MLLADALLLAGSIPWVTLAVPVTQYITTTMSDSVSTVLPQGVGYGVVVGIGSFFTLAMIGISMLQVFELSPRARYAKY